MLAGVVGSAVVAGAGGYALGLNLGRGEQVITVTQQRDIVRQTMLTTVRHMVTQSVTPTLQPIRVRLTTSQGALGLAPYQLIAYKDFNEGQQIAKNAGLTIEGFNIVRGGGEVMKDLLEGRADLVPGLEIMQAASQIEQTGGAVKIFYFCEYGNYYSLVVSPDSQYRSIDDLKRTVREGKRLKVGFSRPGSLSNAYIYILSNILNTRIGEGIEPVSLGEFDAIAAALSRGEIDCFPWSVSRTWGLEERGRGRIIFYFSDYLGNRWHDLCIATTTDYMSKNQEAIRRFVNYWRELVRIWQTNPDLSISLLKAEPPTGIGLTDSSARRWYSTLTPNPIGAPLREALVEVDKYAKLIGLTKNPPPPDQWYTTQFL
ncbi:MAG: ABC transporter substrate-binding protein [Thaumarchaeota archaeon]|nr:ABC transporter substrate-binding protein [Candidatus Calditenuaceae archaeon]